MNARVVCGIVVSVAFILALVIGFTIGGGKPSERHPQDKQPPKILRAFAAQPPLIQPSLGIGHRDAVQDGPSDSEQGWKMMTGSIHRRSPEIVALIASLESASDQLADEALKYIQTGLGNVPGIPPVIDSLSAEANKVFYQTMVSFAVLRGAREERHLAWKCLLAVARLEDRRRAGMTYWCMVDLGQISRSIVDERTFHALPKEQRDMLAFSDGPPGGAGDSDPPHLRETFLLNHFLAAKFLSN